MTAKIRTTIQLAQALAQSEGAEVTFSHIERTINVASQFESNLEWEKFKFAPTEDAPETKGVTLEMEEDGKLEEVKAEKKKKKKKHALEE